MTPGAHGDQIQFGIVTKLTSRADVVHLYVEITSAVLAPPPVAIKDVVPSFLIPTWLDLQPGSPGKGSIHEAVRIFSGTSTF